MTARGCGAWVDLSPDLQNSANRVIRSNPLEYKGVGAVPKSNFRQ
uniref:Uncharacterized protein n=1 Tax=Pseudomonas aeruginosa TaxID=287 RepID=A0A5P9WBJ1_PSEAI|nr:hypothetical protein pNK546KPC_0598 [Pseudomonas aeruginosa]